MQKSKMLLLIIFFVILNSIALAEWEIIFTDDFNRDDGPLEEPWQLMQDTLYIQSEHVIAHEFEYGFMGYFGDDTTGTAAIESFFNFENDSYGRFQFFLGGSVDTTDFGFIAKISTDYISIWKLSPEIELSNINFNFFPETVYKMRLEYNSADSLIKLQVMDIAGSILDTIQANNPSGVFSFCAFGIENLDTYNCRKWFDVVVFEGTNVSTDEYFTILPKNPFLYQNYPNPFNPETTISFSIPKNSKVDISVYNIKGQKIKTITNENFQRGYYEIFWNGKDDYDNRVSCGLYFYKLQSGDATITKKMLLFK